MLMELRGLEPYYHENPWSQALEGKKVMVFSPFANTMKKQYARRKSLWKEERILPKFELEIAKTPLSNYLKKSPYSSWLEGYEVLKKRINSSDADIIITGCGAWSLPLATYAKEYGKQGIHLGGATQILFAIKGRRWDQHDVIAGFYNENWVRPSSEETPEREKIKMVENGCYW
jgi:hypothetical protein